MHKSKNEKGITLVILILMIIVLLVLVGVSVDLIVNKDVFNQARRIENSADELTKQQQDVREDVRDMYR